MYLGVSLLVCMFFSSMTMAQTKTISGTVTDSDGKALVGVTIAVRNTDRVTITGNSGAYSISAATGETLVFSYVGFETQSMRVGSSNSLNVTLSRKVGDLDEVVIVGYGKQRKSDITGAVSNVDMKALSSRPIADLGRGLQGAIPGLSVRIPSGEVGSDPLIRIRGFIGSIAGSSAPLILLDNVEIPSIQLVNPNDVESITILKDASASSIYGAKAAFGVVLITTKKGSNVEGNSLTYSNNSSWQNPFKKIDIAGFDLIVNTTPVGMYPDTDAELPFPYGKLVPGQILYDLIYNPDETDFLKKGKEAGCRTINGMDMLILQAEEGWRIWSALIPS